MTLERTGARPGELGDHDVVAARIEAAVRSGITPPEAVVMAERYPEDVEVWSAWATRIDGPILGD